MVMHAADTDERMDAEVREHGMEPQPNAMPVGDEAWQRALEEKRRLLARKPRSN